ncbi:MAG: DUF4837 family protein [Cyclobacteriaceae bacterium]|nr:DUF4837 family protein [Cyclobacteriaceae bacterium]UYN86456.1 MAG: DUF4837 family protein [Cyclobacteriaceae bacterium]
MRLLLVGLLAAGLWSCNTSEKTRVENLPAATGKPGDMILILDSVQWKGELGHELRKIFKTEVPGLPREEPLFDLIYVYPRKGYTLLTQIRNLVFVFTLDQTTSGSKIMKENFTDETLDRIRTDTSFWLVTARDEYSRGQEVMYLFSDTQENLIKKLQQNGNRIQDYFNTIEKKRILNALEKSTTTKGITEALRKEFDFEIKLPFGFKVADKQNDFVWLRLMDNRVDKNIFISWKPYESEYQLLPDSLILWRDEIAHKYLFDDPENPESYVKTETSVPFKPLKATQVNFNNKFAMELRWLWKTNNNSMGGPFISYGLVDNEQQRLYYIEGFCYSPGKDQRETIRELEAILWTFKSGVSKNNP